MKRSYDGTAVTELDVLLCETHSGRILPSQGTLFRTAEKHTGEHGLQWCVGSRLTGFEKDRNSTTHVFDNLRFRARLCCR